MDYNGNQLLFSSMTSGEQEQAVDMAELGRRAEKFCAGRYGFEAQTKDNLLGYNIHLPSGVDFRLENGVVKFSHFGMTKDEVKQVYNTLYQLGLSGISFVADEQDNDFKKNVVSAHKELLAEEEMVDAYSVRGTRENADNNMPQIDFSKINTGSYLSNKKNYVNNLLNKIQTQKAAASTQAKEVHPSMEDISKYMDDHISSNQKYKTRNYSKTSLSNGYKMIWYKDEDQKKEGPKADKNGKVNPNFEFGLKGEIEYKDNKPTLKVTLLTPKYGDASDGMIDEVLGMAAACKVTHLRFNGPVGMKGKFLNSCAKRMIVPTGVSLGPKDFANMMKMTKDNVFDYDKRIAYYKRLRDHLKEELIIKGNKDATHPYYKMIDDLNTQIALDEIEKENDSDNTLKLKALKAEKKYKNFNLFAKGYINGKVYTDNNDTPLSTFEVQKTEDKTNVAKELATGMAYVDLLSLYASNPKYTNMSQQDLHKEYIKLYNKNLYEIHAELRSDFKKLGPTASSKDKKEIISSKYEEVQSSIQSIQGSISLEGFDKLNVPRLRKFPYYDLVTQERSMINRLRKGHDLYIEEKNALNKIQNSRLQNQGR